LHIRLTALHYGGEEIGENRVKLLKFINLLLALAFATTITGIILYLYGPEAILGSMIAYDIHRYGGLSFSLLAFIHIILNRKWIKSMYFSHKSKKPK
jgi:hypothetical protein